MQRRCRVELFEQIRREYEHGSGTISGTAHKFGVHRRTVRQAIECAVPPKRKKPDRKRAKFDLVKGFIERILIDDERAPRKQRHTAHRIWSRIQSELPDCRIAERKCRNAEPKCNSADPVRRIAQGFREAAVGFRRTADRLRRWASGS